MFKRFPILVSAVVAFTMATAFSAPGNGNGQVDDEPKMLGKGRPFDRDELPPGLQKQYDELPEQAKRNAEEWLQKFSFPERDGDVLEFDPDGAVLYVDPVQPALAPEGEGAALSEGAVPEVGAGAADDAFSLHSRPGAPNLVYLDFDGDVISGTAWNSLAGTTTLTAKPFDLDGNPATFSESERLAIAEIWHRVAEDYATFDIDVTTEEPASFDRYTGHVLVTSKQDSSGNKMPYDTAGGVAYIGVWGYSNYATYYSPALVYFDNLASGTTYIAEACAHEFGHNQGLSHDGTSSVTYYAGHGSGNTSWAPIMGNSYYNNVTQWSKGEYSGANNNQDDIAIIADNLGLAGDDHGDSFNDATALVVEASGEILVTTPESDPHDFYPENKGVIDSADDKDLFVLTADAGPLDLTITPAWDAFYRTSKRGANLDVRAVLLDALGNEVASSDPTSDTHAAISTSVPAGTYYLEVSGVGSSNYSDYASIGQYFVSGSIVPSTATNQAPSASFDMACGGTDCAFSDRSSDPDGTIVSRTWEFGDGGTSSQSNPSHTYVTAGNYNVTLTVTDDTGAQGSASQTVDITIPNTPPTAELGYSCSDLTCIFTDASSDSDGTIQSWAWDFGDGTRSTAQHPSHTYSAGGTYAVTLTVTDDNGASAEASAEATVQEPVAEGVTLTAVGYKERGRQRADLSWDGASSTSIDVYRDGSRVATTVNDGAYTDRINRRGNGHYVYQVCEASTGTCSKEVAVSF